MKYYVFENEKTRTIKDETVFEKSGYFGRIVFRGTLKECLIFMKNASLSAS